MISVDRFTEGAQDVPQRAAEIMQRYGHTQMDTEHILLALMEQPQGVVSQLFKMLKVDANALAQQLDDILCSVKTSGAAAEAGQIFITPRVMRILDLANEEARRMKDEKISTEHMFLGILEERSTPVARLLEGAGINRDQASDSLQQLRGGNAG